MGGAELSGLCVESYAVVQIFWSYVVESLVCVCEELGGDSLVDWEPEELSEMLSCGCGRGCRGPVWLLHFGHPVVS